MASRDPHVSLKNTVIKQVKTQIGQFTLVQQQWSKTDIALSLHVSPNSWTTSGLQSTDFLAMMGFSRSPCSFERGECYVRFVEKDFNVDDFAKTFEDAFNIFKDAQNGLESCGFYLEQKEGWGFFLGGRSQSRRRDHSMGGDGHHGGEIKQLKNSSDNIFEYRFTWIEGAHEKGWVIHYRPKNLPISSEIGSVLRFLKLHEFADCPEFDFESCFWRSIAFSQQDGSFFDSNANIAHGWFDAHAAAFSPAIEKALSANSLVEKFGMGFLPFEAPHARLEKDLSRKVQRPKSGSTPAQSPRGAQQFDVALSFAGAQRQAAEALATRVQEAGYSVFYDDFFPEYLWGKNLVDLFGEIYGSRARYCVMFVSKEYVERNWTNLERQHAQAKALAKKGAEYILPIKCDDAILPGMPNTTGYISIDLGIPKIADLLVKKLRS